MVVEALFWFHPLVWWLGQKMTEERERACDEEVLRSNNDPAVYAEGILNVCKFYVESPLRCVAGVTGSDLKRRIEDIMTHRTADNLNAAKKILLALGAVGALTAPLGIGLLDAPVSQAQMSSFDGRIATSTARRFEVATIKPNKSGSDETRVGSPLHGSISLVNVRLQAIVANSFRTSGRLVFGPAWLKTARYDVVGKGTDPRASNPEVWEMMRSLLMERFHLKYHLENREMPIFALTLRKEGRSLEDRRTDPAPPPSKPERIAATSCIRHSPFASLICR